MLTDQQLIDRLRVALQRETAGIDPPPELLARIHRELLNAPTTHGRRRWRAPSLGGAFAIFGAALALTVTVLALVLIRHHQPPIRAQSPGVARLLVQTADPDAGVPWALRTVRASRSQKCLQVGRLLPGHGAIKQRSFANDPNLEHCAGIDANGHAFVNVFAREVPASMGPSSTNTTCQLGRSGRRAPFCRLTAYRNLAYGLLGPDAVTVTYAVNGHSVTKPTAGGDGSYLIVLPATAQSCVLGPGGGRSCEGGSGETSTTALESGVITAVTYRDGHVCRLPAPSGAGTPSGSCPQVGYAAVKTKAFRPPHITPAQVAAPVSVVTFPPARRLCSRTYPEQTIRCDHRVPRGYKVSFSGLGGQRLVLISFTARLAATNQHSVYEWAMTGQNCSGSGGGSSATTFTPVRAGQRVILRTTVPSCRGRYTGLVTYQPNGWPGHDTLGARQDFSALPRDGSILVGRFSFVTP